jgi:hypothetical protein
MKHFIFSLIFFSSTTLCAQCYDTPSAAFGGTPVSWGFMAVDTFKQDYCPEIINYREQMVEKFKPLIFNTAIIHIADNGSNGVLMTAFDKKNGSTLWQKHLNIYTDIKERLFSCLYAIKRDSSVLEAYFFINKVLFPQYPPPSTGYAGIPNKITFDIETGEILSEVNTDLFSNRVTSNRFQYFIPVVGSDLLMYNLGAYNFSDKNFSFRMYPQFLDKNTMAKVDAPFMIDTIFMKHFDSDGFTPGYDIYGPYKQNDTSYLYSIQYRWQNKWNTELIKINDKGQLQWRKDITDQMIPPGFNEPSWHLYSPETDGDKIRFESRQRLNGSRFDGHVGYTEVDMDGLIIKKRAPFVIDGKKAGHLKTIHLRQSEDLLHCMRFDKDKNLYFYRESPEGFLTKVGELINPNREIYAFLPWSMTQDDNGDIFLSMTVRIDSTWAGGNFNEGGWQFLIKIEGSALGISVHTEDTEKANAGIRLSPNPVYDVVTLTDVHHHAVATLYDAQGRTLITKTISPEDNSIDLVSYPDGIYFIKIETPGTAHYKTLKLVKVSR